MIIQTLENKNMGFNLTSDQISTGVGSCLLHIVAGITTIWGSTNIYYLSYFHHNNYPVNENTNSFILISIIIPISITLLLSTKISDRLGYTQTIQLCSWIFFASQIILYIKLTLVLFTIFTLIIPVAMITVSLIPTVSILWSHFLRQKSICTAITLVFLGLGTIIWNIAFIELVNPDNEQAIIDQNQNAYFSTTVTSNIKRATKIIMFICSILFVIGGFLIKQSKPMVQQDEEQKKAVQLKNQDALDKQQQNAKEKNKASQRNILMKGSQDIIIIEEQKPSILKSQLQGKISKKAQRSEFCRALKDPKCLLIFALLIVIDIYPIYLFSNFKVIFMPIFNDDHFLALCIVVNTVSNILGTFLWGFIAHKIGNISTVAFVGTFALVGGILGFFTYNKIVILFFMFVFGVGDRGMQTIAGPVLVQIYGLRIATLLLPYKGLSLIVGFLLAPVFQIITSSFLSPYQVLKSLFIYCAISFLIGIYYTKKYQQFSQNSRSQLQKRKKQIVEENQQQYEEYQQFEGQPQLQSKITES